MPNEDTNESSRSPRYPSFDLGWSIDAIERIFRADGKAPMERDSAAQHLGYKGLSGSSAKAIATLSYYDLVEAAGQGRVRLTERALEIHYSHEPQEKLLLVQETLEKPKIFSELIAHYGGIENLPSDVTLIKELAVRRRFGDVAAKECVATLKKSIAYLKDLALQLGISPTLEIKREKKPEESEGGKNLSQDFYPTPFTSVKEVEQEAFSASDVIPVRLSENNRAELRVYSKMSRKEAIKLKSWLDAVVKPWIDYMSEEAEELNTEAN